MDGERLHSTALEREEFDLAFLDIRMPGATGLEVLERARTAANETSVVIITAQSTFENAVEAMKLGALDYLTKPFTLAEVQALAEKALRTRALELEVRALRLGAAELTLSGDGDGDDAITRQIVR